MTLYLASGKDPTADSGQWVIIVQANTKGQALARINHRMKLSNHKHLLKERFYFQELPVGTNGLLYCNCTGAPQ